MVTETEKVRTRDPTQKVDCKKRMKEATRGCSPSLSFFLLWYYSPLHSSPSSLYNRWSSFSIAAIFVYGTSRRRKRGRSDDAEEASVRGGCGRESEDVRPLGWARKVGKPVARICRQLSGADSEWLIL